MNKYISNVVLSTTIGVQTTQPFAWYQHTNLMSYTLRETSIRQRMRCLRSIPAHICSPSSHSLLKLVGFSVEEDPARVAPASAAFTKRGTGLAL